MSKKTSRCFFLISHIKCGIFVCSTKWTHRLQRRIIRSYKKGGRACGERIQAHGWNKNKLLPVVQMSSLLVVKNVSLEAIFPLSTSGEVLPSGAIWQLSLRQVLYGATVLG